MGIEVVAMARGKETADDVGDWVLGQSWSKLLLSSAKYRVRGDACEGGVSQGTLHLYFQFQVHVQTRDL